MTSEQIVGYDEAVRPHSIRHSGLDPESRGASLDSGFRRNDVAIPRFQRDSVLEQRGEIIGFAQGRAQIRVERASSACAGCGSRSACASGQAAAQVIQIALPGAARVGDRVTVSMPDASLALAALLGYLLPPVGLLIGALIAATVFTGDAPAVLGAGLGFVGGLLLARLISRFTFECGLAPSVCNHGTSPTFNPDSSSGEPS